jgi:hypothetical protein
VVRAPTTTLRKPWRCSGRPSPSIQGAGPSANHYTTEALALLWTAFTQHTRWSERQPLRKCDAVAMLHVQVWRLTN